ncbi:MAG: NADP-dependent phosphogluconate dehydrogenase [Burkholderiaceae bacterium]
MPAPALSCTLGLIGLGVMGENLALNAERNGLAVCGFDADAAKRQRFADRTRGLNAHAADDLAQLVAALQRPRRILMMVPAGAAVDAVLDALTPLLQAGDIVIDGGNTHHADTRRRLQAAQARGLHYVGMGVSGGERGALWGPALMPGGDERAWPVLRPMLQAMAARAGDGAPCCEWIGPEGAGHFVKMVHNGIEYADMQLICEAYALMRDLLGMPAREMALVFRRWNDGPLESYLIQITADILERNDPDTGQALVDCILDTAEQKGTGKWTSQVALDLGTPVPTIAQAVFARSLSAMKSERMQASALLSGAGAVVGAAVSATDRAQVLAWLEGALWAAKVCAYAQGLSLLRAADAEHRWGLSLSTIASVWRAGCIIRARLLEDIRQAHERNSALAHLLLDAPLAARMATAQQDLREVVSLGARAGVALPAMMSALAYHDALRSQRLPANLLQAQRDFFGAHGYQRIDRPGQFHTDWQAQQG